MFLLALMMSSCPDREPSGISKNISRGAAVQIASDDLREKMENRGIPFDSIVNKDESGRRYVNITFLTKAGNTRIRELFEYFTVEKSEGSMTEKVPIAHYELSKYFYPLLEDNKNGIDYISLTIDKKSISLTKGDITESNINELKDYEIGIEDKADRFTRNLYHFKEGERYIDTLFKKVIEDMKTEKEEFSEELTLKEEFSQYIYTLEFLIFALSERQKEFFYFNGPKLNDTFNNDDYFSESSRRIIRGIIEDHESAFRNALKSNLYDYIKDDIENLLSLLDS